MAPSWRLLDTGALPAADNMALDEVLLVSRGQGLAPDTLRFMQFDPDCALVGYHQVVEDEIDLDYCRAHGIEVNRRLTGGGAIYCHRSQVGWELALAETELPQAPGTAELARWACQGALLGLEHMGVHASFAGKNDLLLNGRKVGGCGGVSLGGSHLIHGSLLVEEASSTMFAALRIHPAKLSDKQVASASARVTCLAAEMGQAPSSAAIKQALVQGFAEATGARPEPGALSPGERGLLRQLLPRYRSPQWVFGPERSLHGRRLASAVKLPGGLVRVSLSLAPGGRRLAHVAISGDFFAHPPEAIGALEYLLRGVEATEDAVLRAVADWASASGAAVPGVGPDGLAHAILRAVSAVDAE